MVAWASPSLPHVHGPPWLPAGGRVLLVSEELASTPHATLSRLFHPIGINIFRCGTKFGLKSFFPFSLFQLLTSFF